MTDTRICSKCKVEKPATDEFYHAYKRSPDGRRSVCRVCRAAEYWANRDGEMAKRRAHYQANKDRIKAEAVKYYWHNAEQQRASALKRHHENRDKRLAQMREYRAANVDALNERRRPRAREIFQQRYGIDLQFTLKHRVRSLLRVTLTMGRPGKRMSQLLGYSLDELKTHLERQFTKGMTWERFLAGEIHIDHIIPIASFSIPSEDCEDFRRCWSLANLRPAWAKDNLSKRDKVLTLL